MLGGSAKPIIPQYEEWHVTVKGHMPSAATLRRPSTIAASRNGHANAAGLHAVHCIPIQSGKLQPELEFLMKPVYNLTLHLRIVARPSVSTALQQQQAAFLTGRSVQALANHVGDQLVVASVDEQHGSRTNARW